MKPSRSPTIQRAARGLSVGQMEGGSVVTGLTDRVPTVALKACGACRAGLFEDTNFCRWCGARQKDEIDTACVTCSNAASLCSTPYSTHGHMDFKKGFYHPVSGPLVNALVQGMAANLAVQHRARVVQSIIETLILIPIWLAILLLSPLDAYSAAKVISRSVR